MRHHSPTPLLFVILSLAIHLQAAPNASDLASQAKAILQRSCFECHGNDVQKADLRLDLGPTAAAKVLTHTETNPAELIRRVSLPRSDAESMPRRGKPLTPEEISTLTQWLQQGAAWPQTADHSPQHWAYQKPQKTPLPTVSNPDWIVNEIDSFILQKLEANQLEPSPPAAPATLARRLHLTLTGLPPSVEEIQSFEKDYAKAPQKAISTRAQQLLDSPEFGVRWARHWLDLARYADSHGFQRDDLREVWGYRDWVVKALNDDLPFDQFTLHQLAGDLIAQEPDYQNHPERDSLIIATGFHRCTPTNVEAGTEPEESRINQVLDRVNTTGAVWMGATLECAQCHNHKYDPFTQEDYYSLMAYFNNTPKEAERANPKIPGSIAFQGIQHALSTAGNPELTTLQKQKNQLQKEITAAQNHQQEAFQTWLANARTQLLTSPAYHPLHPLEATSEEGASFKELPDESLLVTGTNPDKDTYHITYQLPNLQNVTAIRLEALTDPSLTINGPGRASPRPNFVLNHFSASIAKANTNDDASTPLAFAHATADFSQPNFHVTGALDPDPDTAWAINPKFSEPHHAIFELETPWNASTTQELRISLVQHYGGSRTLGRFRISLVTGSTLSLSTPPEILAILKKKPSTIKPAERKLLQQHFETNNPTLERLNRQLANLEKRIAAIKPPTSEVMQELPQPRMTTIFKRGEYTSPGQPVQPATPAVLPRISTTPDRHGLAQWIVSPENPLTARVTVNRWWAEIFGQGIVTTVEDFGIKGEPPTHPELLDYLAVTLMEKQWSMKKILHLIVTSATFQQQSHLTTQLQQTDPTNSLLSRGPRFRLDAEGIRDNALSIAGLLSLHKGGPPIYPPQPEGLWRKVGGQQYNYTVSQGEKKYRRGLYVVLKRGAPNPSFTNFDASSRMACVVSRSRSNTPLQALTLLNDPVYVEAAESFAKSISQYAATHSLEQAIQYATRTALGRIPNQTETTILAQLYSRQFTEHQNKEKAWLSVATALLNLDECITIN
jgi:mono/diheme cytochrome c family protein